MSTVVVEEKPPVVVHVVKPYVPQYPMNYFDSTEASDYDPTDYEGPVFLGYGTRKRAWREKKPKSKKDKNQQANGKTLPLVLSTTPRSHGSDKINTTSSSNTNNNNNSSNAHGDNKSVAELDNWDKILSVVYTNDDADYDDDGGDDSSRIGGDLIQKITPPSPTGVTMIELVLNK